MAGNSADDVARAARDKAERLIRRAELFERGAEGERVVASLLAQLPPEWFVLNDLHWPGRERANIDHVVVGPAGVFVIDAKNWSGELKIVNGVLRQNGYSRKSTTDGAMAASRAIGSLVSWLNPRQLVPVLCFVGDAKAYGAVDGVWVCSSETLLHALQAGPPVLSAEQLECLRYELDMSTGNARESTSNRRKPVARANSAATVRSVNTRPAPRRPTTGMSAVARASLNVARVMLSFVAWAISLSIAMLFVSVLGGYSDNVAAPVGLGVGGLCGWLVWRQFSPGRPVSVRPRS